MNPSGINMGSGDLNSGPQACITIAYPQASYLRNHTLAEMARSLQQKVSAAPVLEQLHKSRNSPRTAEELATCSTFKGGLHLPAAGDCGGSPCTMTRHQREGMQ